MVVPLAVAGRATTSWKAHRERGDSRMSLVIKDVATSIKEKPLPGENPSTFHSGLRVLVYRSRLYTFFCSLLKPLLPPFAESLTQPPRAPEAEHCYCHRLVETMPPTAPRGFDE